MNWTNWIIEARTPSGEFLTNWFLPAPSFYTPEQVLRAHMNVEMKPVRRLFRKPKRIRWAGAVFSICLDGEYRGPPINFCP